MSTCAICRHQPAEHGHVCDDCRWWLAKDLGEIAGLTGLLPLVTAAPNGSEAGLPVRLSALDLDLPLWGGASAETVHDEYGDQHGQVPVAARLDSWVQDWAAARNKGEALPGVSVPNLVGWLLNRLHDACDDHPAIADFAAEVRTIKAAISRALSTEPMRAVHYTVRCPRCEAETLTRGIGADWIECGTCGRLWSAEGYARLVRDVVPVLRLLTTLEAATYAGTTPARIRSLVHRKKLRRDIGPWGGENLFNPTTVREDLNLDQPLRTPMTDTDEPTDPADTRPITYIVLGAATDIRAWRTANHIPMRQIIAGCSPQRLRGVSRGPFVLVTLDSWKNVKPATRSSILADLIIIRQTATIADHTPTDQLVAA